MSILPKSQMAYDAEEEQEALDLINEAYFTLQHIIGNKTPEEAPKLWKAYVAVMPEKEKTKCYEVAQSTYTTFLRIGESAGVGKYATYTPEYCKQMRDQWMGRMELFTDA